MNRRAALIALVFTVPAVASQPSVEPQTRAGHPQEVSRLAARHEREHFTGGYVGGTRLVRGDSRGPHDGTWGWDYTAFGRRPGRVFLGWAHDRRVQEPTGKYATDGPRPREQLRGERSK